MAHAFEPAPVTPPSGETASMARPSGTVLPPLPWVDSPPNNRPTYVSPKPQVNGRPGLQPREARVSRNEALIDLAAFLRDNPHPVSTRSITPGIESKQGQSKTPPRTRFVRRVLNTGAALQTPRSNASSSAKSNRSPKRFKPLYAIHKSTRKAGLYQSASSTTRSRDSDTEGSKKPPVSKFQVSTTSSLPNQDLEAAPFHISRPGSSPILNLRNLRGDDDHIDFVSWLEREIKGQRRQDMSDESFRKHDVVKTEHKEQESPASESLNDMTAVQGSTPNAAESVNSEASLSFREDPGPEVGKSPQLQSKSEESLGFPKRATALSSHPTGLISPPPKIPLPPSPTSSTHTTSYALNPRPLNMQNVIDQQSFGNRGRDSMQHHLVQRREENSIRSDMPSPNAIDDSFDPSTGEGIVIPATHNVGVPWSVEDSKQVSSGARETSALQSSTLESPPRDTEATRSVTADVAATVSPARTATVSPARTTTSRSSSATQSEQRKAREDRTRAMKLKHLHREKPDVARKSTEDNETATSTAGAALSDPIQRPGSQNSQDIVENALINEIQEAARPNQSSGATEPTKAIDESSTTYKALNLSGFVDKRLHKPPSLDFGSSVLRSRFKPCGSASPTAITPATLSPATPRDMASALADNTTASPHQLLPAIQFQAKSSPSQPQPPPTQSIPPPPSSTNSARNSGTLHLPPLDRESGNTSPLPPLPATKMKLKPQPDRRQLKNRISHLERENKLLEAALMAVLKTGGALNRCPCPCYCDSIGDGEDIGTKSSGDERTADTVASTGHADRRHSRQQGSDSGVEVTTGPESPDIMKAENEAVERQRAKEERWSYGTSVSGYDMGNVAGSRSSGGSALALYMQTRRASGFGMSTAATTTAFANARIT